VSVGAAQGKPAPRRRWARIAGAIAVLLLLLAVALRIALQPEHVTGLVLDQLGNALGLEITANGPGEYRLGGSPVLVVRDVVAREPGAKTPILRAERVLLSLPWSTIRTRGAELTITRVELDAPVLDVPALQHWLATRPPSETRIPTLSDGLYVTRGRIDNGDWHIDGIAATLPDLHPGQPVNAQVRGRYLDPPTSIPFDLSVALSKPANGAGAAIVGPITLDRGTWRMPARINLSGPVLLGDDDLRVQPARLKMSARYQSGDTDLPFALGLSGPLHFDNATWTLAPVGVALRGQDMLPGFDARGALALGRRLVVRLDGRLPNWPDTWPTLPVPVGQSTSCRTSPACDCSATRRVSTAASACTTCSPGSTRPRPLHRCRRYPDTSHRHAWKSQARNSKASRSRSKITLSRIRLSKILPSPKTSSDERDRRFRQPPAGLVRRLGPP